MRLHCRQRETKAVFDTRSGKDIFPVFAVKIPENRGELQRRNTKVAVLRPFLGAIHLNLLLKFW